MVNELWKICSNYPTIEVSNLGNCRRAKLKESQIHEICKLFQDTNIKTQDVADMFGISLAQVQKIRCGIAWKEVWNLYSIDVNYRTRNFKD